MLDTNFPRPERSRSTRSVLLLLTPVVVYAMTLSGGTARGEALKEYCSPSGDYCTAITKRDGRIKLKIRTFSFSTYLVCVTGPRGTDCLQATAERERCDVRKDRIDLKRRFPQGPGKYRVRWKVAGAFLGPALSVRCSRCDEAVPMGRREPLP